MRVLALSFVLFAAGCGGDPAGSGGTTTTSTGGTSTTATGGTGAGGSDTGGTGTTTQTEGLGGTTSSGGTGGVTASTGGTTGGTGGLAGGTGGTGGDTTTSTTTTTSIGMPGPCTWGDDCGGAYYCDALGCGAGQCTLKPPPAGPSPSPDPVCGCDGVTYWSPDVAASKGQSIATFGACPAPIACGPGAPCPVGQRCSRIAADGLSCSPDATGECWGTPLSCALDGPKARACTTATCELQCSLIQSENPWYEDPSCN